MRNNGEYIRKRNHAIAVFMDDFYDTGLEPSYYIHKNKEYTLDESQYHSSWDWLMSVIDKIEGLGFRVSLSKYACQVYQLYADFPDNFIIDADFQEDRLANAFDGISAFAEWWENRGSTQPALQKYSELQKEVDEFINDWLQEKVIFNEENIFETELQPGKIRRWYAVHPKDGSNRKYLEGKMKARLRDLLNQLKRKEDEDPLP